MKVNVDLRLKDVPGQLVLALEPISANGGNIVGVVHHRDVVVGGRITVNVTFEIKSDKILERILETWKEREIDVSRLGSIYETISFEYLLVGDISTSELNGVVKEIESMEGLESINIKYSVSHLSDGKAAFLIGKVRKHETLEKIEELLNEEAHERRFLVIRSLED
ncbi:MAG: hypothetical protein QHH00_02950 [Methanomassiliicoccales archaeon]|nr:hypothetical protein [Methanomassiliicoccales archaeon]